MDGLSKGKKNLIRAEETLKAEAKAIGNEVRIKLVLSHGIKLMNLFSKVNCEGWQPCFSMKVC